MHPLPTPVEAVRVASGYVSHLLERRKEAEAGVMRRRQRLYIITQRYPCANGSRPLSFAVYLGRTFLCYSWSLAGAWVALAYLRERMR